MAFNEVCLLFQHLGITYAATLTLYKSVSLFPNSIFNLSLTENYWPDLHEIYRINSVI